MSYKIEITADSISELTGKLLALAAATQPSLSDPIMPEVKELTKAPARKGRGKAEEQSASTAAGTGSSTATEAAAEAPPESATSSAEGNPTNETSPQPSDTSNTSAADTTSDETTTNSEVAPEAAKPLDFDKDVAPIVLAAVKQRSKEWVQEILAQFGAARASQVPDDQLQELVDAITAGLE